MADEINWGDPIYSDTPAGADTTSYNSNGTTNTGGTAYSGDLTSGSGLDLTQIQKLLSGTGAGGMAGQMLGLGGIGALLNKVMGGGSQGGYSGYQGSIPSYTASRIMNAIPQTVPTAAQAEVPATATHAAIPAVPAGTAPRRPGSGGITYFSPMQYTPTGAAAGTGIATGTGATSGTDAAKGTGIATGAGATTGTTSGGQLTPELAKYIADQKELAKFDAGINWEYNPTTQTFNGYGMTGPVSKTLVEMQNEIKGMPAKSDTPTDIMAAVKAANPNLDWSKYNPNKMTMDYDQFDQARDAYMAKINPGFNQNKYSGAAEQAAAAANTQMLRNGAESALAGGGSIGGYSHGGISALGGYSDGGRLLKGPGDGVSDSIPAMIGKKQPARLADGEFVVPARIVSELGNGSTEAGARKLYTMMDRIKKARNKATNIAADTKSAKYLPA